MVMEMFFKWMGGILILFSSAGMGFWMVWQWKGRLRTLLKLRQMVYFLKGEITYSHAALAEALERVGKRDGGDLGELFTSAAEQICLQEGDSFQEIWNSQIEEMMKKGAGTLLTEEDEKQLKQLGEHLGYLDVDMQEKTLLLYLEQLDLSIEYLQKHQKEHGRLCTSLGVAGGMFLILVMY